MPQHAALGPAGDGPESQGAYSFGARQTVARMFQHHPGYLIHPGALAGYQQQLARSKFCLAPAGWGWGGRVKSSVVHGCVPVIVQVGSGGAAFVFPPAGQAKLL